MKTLIHTVLALGIVMPLAQGQDPQELDKLLAKLSDKNIEDVTIFNLRKYSDPRVTTALRDAFKNNEEKLTRQYIAISLVRQGDKDDEYFLYIEMFAKEAVESDAPDMFMYGADGVALRPVQWSPEFYAWSAQHGIPIELAFKQTYQTYPRDLMLFGEVLVGEARDPRGVELLRRGLQSHNPIVVGVCAQILAQMNDTPSIPSILRLINTSSRTRMAEMLAGSVALFNGDQVERQIQAALVSPKIKEYYSHQIHEKHKRRPSVTR